ncbi:hydrophobin-315 [Hysterangium stoloniferum]|nr:hydrophobin-315 [Hysterangium stoloniferum]
MKFVLAVPAVFGLLAAAAAPPPVSQCNTGTPKCCKNVGAASSGPISALLKPLNVVLDDPTAIVGLDCTPLTLVGGGKGADCDQQPVCCKDVKSNGAVNVGCTPISL